MMIGGRWSFEFEGRPPLLLRVLWIATFVNFGALMVVETARRAWNQPKTPPWLRLDLALFQRYAFGAHFVFLAAIGVSMFIFRRRVVRLPSVPQIGDHPPSRIELGIAATMAPAAMGFVSGMIAGAAYSQWSHSAGVALGGINFCVAALVSDAFIRSFPGPQPSRRARLAVGCWSLMVTGVVMLLVGRGFGV